MLLRHRHRVAAKMIAGGLSMQDVAKELMTTPQKINVWMKFPEFKDEVRFWINKANEIFEQRMNNVLPLVADRMIQIMREGKDSDSNTAIQLILKTRGKLVDKYMVKKDETDEFKQSVDSALDDIERSIRGSKVEDGGDKK